MRSLTTPTPGRIRRAAKRGEWGLLPVGPPALVGAYVQIPKAFYYELRRTLQDSLDRLREQCNNTEDATALLILLHKAGEIARTLEDLERHGRNAKVF